MPQELLQTPERKRVSGTLLSLIGAAFAVIGTAFAAVGAFLSSDANRVQSEELAKKSDELARKSDEIARLNREVADISRNLVGYVTGADSYIYLHVFRFGQPKMDARFVHVGQYPVRETEIILWDISDQAPGLRAGRTDDVNIDAEPKLRFKADVSFPGQPVSLLGNAIETNPTRDSYMYFVYFNGGSGTFREVLEFVKVKGEWKHAYRVEGVPFNKPRVPIGEYFDEGFPTDRSVYIHASDYGYPRLEPPPVRRPLAQMQETKAQK